MARTTILISSVLSLVLVTPLDALRVHSEQKVDKTKCPTVEVKGPRKNKALKSIFYQAKIKNFPADKRPGFKWSVLGAKVLAGQGSDMITVRAQAEEVKATLVIENFPAPCHSNSDEIVTRITDIPFIHPPPVISSITALPWAIIRPCPRGTKSDTCLRTGNEVELRVDAMLNHPGVDSLLYTWSVTAGRLKGEGATVIWDLSGVASGTYTVTAEVGYFSLKATSSARVSVADCGDCKTTSSRAQQNFQNAF